MLSSSFSVPHTMSSHSYTSVGSHSPDVPHTMLSPSMTHTSSVPHATLSAQFDSVPQTKLSCSNKLPNQATSSNAMAVPHTMLSHSRTTRGSHSVVVPQTMLSSSPEP